MTRTQTKRRADGSITEQFKCIPVGHKSDCPKFDDDSMGWGSNIVCTCGTKYFLEEEIKQHEQEIAESLNAVRILKELLEERP